MTAVLEDIGRYLKAKLPNIAGIDDKALLAALVWHRNHDLLRATMEESGRITGVIVYRRVDEGVNARAERYAHEESAPVLWVDWLAADSSDHLCALIAELPGRFPVPPRFVSGVLGRRNHRPLRVPLARMVNLIL